MLRSGKLRTALGDCADDPTFIETVPRRGYRFVAKLDEAPVELLSHHEGVSLATAVLAGCSTVL
jgi:DNA-binding winged helix-turn-helix (wHTH) protein